MRDFYVFDIPIYICPEADYEEALKNASARYIRRIFSTVRDPQTELPDQCRFLENKFRDDFGGTWRFNQVVSWLRLYIEGCDVGGHLWRVDGKRLQRRMRKRFCFLGGSNVLASRFKPEDDSPKIYRDTLAAIEHLSGRREYQGRFFDLDAFKRLGPFIDWRALMDFETKRYRDIGRSGER